ncbi:hypothetical protein P154DRAFT_523635 [Amniculicola lignicola CBS 123094]|uniref:Response regulatory domain-containing protein n=1 Tax=Amniculicola lignicola CBS 123094 TaxID=1392246 RepID=A0A6A5WAU0_9PLEO|nr:hypothetical protein P154DRAFT_523635 [Amniculicola lignicola CBS 123094]
MGDLKTRIRSKLLRKNSTTSTAPAPARSSASSAGSEGGQRKAAQRSGLKSASLTKLPEVATTRIPHPDDALSQSAVLPRRTGGLFGIAGNGTEESLEPKSKPSLDNTVTTTASSPPPSPTAVRANAPQVTLEEPTPIHIPVQPPQVSSESVVTAPEEPPSESEEPSELPPSTRSTSKATPPDLVRRQSLVTTSNARIIKTLLEPPASGAPFTTGPPTADYFTAGMLHRKIWVKRANASATLVQIREDDLVDDVRDMILRKYNNSLGKTFDSPDLTLRIVPRVDSKDSNSTAKGKYGDRPLGPEEEMCRTLDAYYPGGQTVNEALLIEVPQRRTPKASPRVPLYYTHHDDTRPYDSQSEYFPPMLPVTNPSPSATTVHSHDSRQSIAHPPTHSISVMQTGQLPPLPSPGSMRRAHHSSRPKNPRHNTASPTILANLPTVASTSRPQARPRHDSSASETKHSIVPNAPIPTPPVPTDPTVRQTSSPPTPRIASPRPDKKVKKRRVIETPSLPAGLLDGSVPPINVLIVEDNIINLRVLGAFMQRLKVRWQRAMNGKEAVDKWRAGGFHLVLMDIQLPIMNGLEATKEIRRLERVNSIGVFSSGNHEAPNLKAGNEIKEEDTLTDRSLFKSPVIIVALTASSLQSDRHEALAAGCNDFLTKPVNFVWLERKVKEWGCMQALIDFDGWRKWKDFAAQSDTNDATSKISTSYSSIAPRSKPNTNLSPTSAANAMNGKMGPTAANGVTTLPKPKDEEKKNKRKSLGVVAPPTLPEEDSPPVSTKT